MKRATRYQETWEQNGCGSQQLGNLHRRSESPPLHLQLLVAGNSACRSNELSLLQIHECMSLEPAQSEGLPKVFSEHNTSLPSNQSQESSVITGCT